MACRKIADLPLNVKRDLATTLDSRQPSSGNYWRSLIQLMPPDVIYRGPQIESFAMALLQPNGSPTRALLADLANRGIAVPQLATWIGQLHLRTPSPRLQMLLTLLQDALAIISQPNELYKQPEGSSVTIHCEASSSTVMSYQWFKKRKSLAGKIQTSLQLSNVCQEDEGYYICRVAISTGQCVFTNWAKLELTDSKMHLAKPLITSQPQSMHIALGGILHLYCDAVGDPAPEYQWYKNECPIPEARQREYDKANMCLDDEGKFFCVASNSAGQAVSEVVDVHVFKNTALSPSRRGMEIEQGVSDKIALLIGNKDYRNENLGTLYHPTNDVCELAGVLGSIGFKVVSLVNLTLSEMRFAVKQFCTLLDKDMYALFYFAGHGFEDGNQSYLMPIDASTSYVLEENLSASEVIEPMQNSQAKLNVILFDSCRTRPSKSKNLPPKKSVEKKNVVIAFGCCPKRPVFENEAKANGYFAIHLLEHIGKEEDIDAVLRDVSGGIDKEDIRDPETGEKQVVYRNTTLTEPLSLKAPLNPNARINSTDGWKAAHEIPETHVFNEDGCDIELMFYAEFSNVLLVKAQVQRGSEATVNFTLEQKENNGCVIEQVTEKEQTFALPNQFRSNQAIRISDLQRLEGDLIINLEVKLEKDSKPRSIEYKMKEKPLYAKIVQA